MIPAKMDILDHAENVDQAEMLEQGCAPIPRKDYFAVTVLSGIMNARKQPTCSRNPVFRVGVCGFMHAFGHLSGWKKELPNCNLN
jgi:hypothetical protein